MARGRDRNTSTNNNEETELRETPVINPANISYNLVYIQDGNEEIIEKSSDLDLVLDEAKEARTRAATSFQVGTDLVIKILYKKNNKQSEIATLPLDYTQPYYIRSAYLRSVENYPFLIDLEKTIDTSPGKKRDRDVVAGSYGSQGQKLAPLNQLYKKQAYELFIAERPHLKNFDELIKNISMKYSDNHEIQHAVSKFLRNVAENTSILRQNDRGALKKEYELILTVLADIQIAIPRDKKGPFSFMKNTTADKLIAKINGIKNELNESYSKQVEESAPQSNSPSSLQQKRHSNSG